MKKIFISYCIICALLFCGCANQGTGDMNNDVGEIEEIEETVPDNSNLETNKDSALPSRFVIDEELALEIGNAVLKSFRGEEFMKETEASVREHPDRFVIYRELKDKRYVGGGMSVSISKKNGQILKIQGYE